MMATVQAVMINVQVLPSRHGDRVVVDPLDMRLPKGRIYGFLGPNGCGKITTLRMLCGLRTPDAGEGTCIKLACRRPGG